MKIVRGAGAWPVAAGAVAAVPARRAADRSPSSAIRRSRSTTSTRRRSRNTRRAVLQLAARGLSAGVEDGADAEGGARRRRRRAGQAALRRRGLPVHAHAREGEPAREGLLDRQDRRRPRDDRRRDRVGSDHGEAGGEPRPPRQARRSAHDQHGRCAGREAGRRHRRRSTTSPARSTRRKPDRRPR